MTTNTSSTSTLHESLPAALAAFQEALPRIGKAESATIPGKDGQRGYSYKYADLHDVTHAVIPLLAAHGLSFTAGPTVHGDRFVLAYRLLHDGGERIEGYYPLPDPARATPQQVGSAITYARRYALSAVTGVVPDEDDDGAQAPPVQQRPEWYYRTVEFIQSMDEADKASLRTWVEAEGLPPQVGEWTEEQAKAVRHRAHQIAGR